MQKETQRLGKNLRRIRTKKNISQGDLARILHSDKSFVSTIENGKANPTLATLAKLAKAVGVTVSVLLR